MLRGVEMRGRVLVWRIVTAADMAAGAADPQMQPYAADLQAFLAAERARRDVADAGDVGTALCHLISRLNNLAEIQPIELGRSSRRCEEPIKLVAQLDALATSYSAG